MTSFSQSMAKSVSSWITLPGKCPKTAGRTSPDPEELALLMAWFDATDSCASTVRVSSSAAGSIHDSMASRTMDRSASDGMASTTCVERIEASYCP
jgi:hypothetical protein